MFIYYTRVLVSWVYCAMQMLFAILSLLLNLTLQCVDFLFCRVWCHC